MLYTYRQLQQLLKVARQLDYVPPIKLNLKKESLQEEWNNLDADVQAEVVHLAQLDVEQQQQQTKEPSQRKRTTKAEYKAAYHELKELQGYWSCLVVDFLPIKDVRRFLNIARAYGLDVPNFARMSALKLRETLVKVLERMDEQERRNRHWYKEPRQEQQQQHNYTSNKRSIFINGYDIFSVPMPRARQYSVTDSSYEWTVLSKGVLGHDFKQAKSNFRKLARQWHPDMPTGDTEVFQILSNMMDRLEWLHNSSPFDKVSTEY